MPQAESDTGAAAVQYCHLALEDTSILVPSHTALLCALRPAYKKQHMESSTALEGEKAWCHHE